MRVRSGSVIAVVIVAVGIGTTALGVRLRAGRSVGAVVLVTIDTLRADRVGACGGPAGLTPELDALAADGVVFTAAWTTAPLTVPAHTSALTGLIPPLHGLRTNTSGLRLPDAAARPYSTVAEVLRAEGFATGAFVSASVLRAASTGLDAGFDVYDDVPAAAPGALHDTERAGTETVAAALDWVRGQTTRVFLWVHLFDPHAPYDAPPPWGAGSAHTQDADGYAGEVRFADHAVGILRRGLTEAGFGDAVIVVAADHGESLGAHGEPTHGYLLHEETLHVPLIVHAPTLVAAGLRRDEPVSLIDVAPTLVSLAGVNVPPTMDGRPLFAGGGGRERRAPYAESLYGHESARWAQVFALRVGDRKLVDAGPHVLDVALGGPHPDDDARLVAWDAGDDVLATVRNSLRRVAALPPLAPPATAVDALAGGSYWSPATSRVGSIVPEGENRALASPYDRMDVLRLLDRGRTLLDGGAAGAAVRTFREAVDADPGNPQAARWLARALFAARDPAAAAAGYRHAFDLGWTHPDCLAKALQASADAVRVGDSDEIEAGLRFLATARGRGVRQDGPAYVFEAFLQIRAGRPDAARQALDAARAEPPTPWLSGAIENVATMLR